MTNDLIARIESADGPSRELDEAIERAVGRYTAFQHYTLGDDDTPDYVPTRYTASIDAALTLVPDGMAFTVARYWCEGEDAPPYYADCIDLGLARRGEDAPVYSAKAATPALALCIAALRAQEKDTNA